MDSLIKNTLEAELSTSGLTEVESNPDVYVNYHASTSTDIQLRSDSYGYGYGGYGMGTWGGYYGMSAGPVSTTTRVVEYENGHARRRHLGRCQERARLARRGHGLVTRHNVEKNQKTVVKAIGKLAAQGRKLWAKELERREEG